MVSHKLVTEVKVSKCGSFDSVWRESGPYAAQDDHNDHTDYVADARNGVRSQNVLSEPLMNHLGVPHHRRGEKQGVDAVEHAAVAGD